MGTGDIMHVAAVGILVSPLVCIVLACVLMIRNSGG